MPVSIKDIARLAGVSHSTVSRALRDSPLIPQSTTRRIQKIAEEQGYTASAIARSLVERKTNAIGVVVTSVADPFNGDVVDGIEQTANAQGYSVILATSQTEPARELAVVKSFAERRVDGILVASSRVGSLYLPVLAQLRVPVVLINNQGGEGNVSSVSVNNSDGAQQATTYLLSLGHRRIVYVGDRRGYQSDVERAEGFHLAFDKAGLVNTPGQLTLQGDGTLDGGRKAAQEFLALPEHPTAAFCYNDMTALGFVSELARHNVRVPGDVSVIGFDDIVFSALANPALTTMRQPRRELGVQGMSMLLSLVAGHLTPRAVSIQTELVVRDSTATLGV